MIKILQLTSGSRVGGIEKMLSSFIPGLNKQGFCVYACSTAMASDATKLLRLHGVDVVDIYSRNPLLFLVRLIRFLKKEKIDLIHLYGTKANVFGGIGGLLAGVPVVVTGVLSTKDDAPYLHTLIERFTRPLVDLYIANAKACAISLVRRAGVDPSKVMTIYDGIQLECYAKATGMSSKKELLGIEDNNRKIIGTISNIRPMKGLDILLKAAREILEEMPDTIFVIIGTDYMNGKYQRYADELGIGDHVIFTGYRDDTAELISTFDIMVVSSSYEGFPVSILEAMAASKPVVSTGVSGIPEVISHNENGLLVPPGDAGALKNAIIRLLNEAPLRKKFGEANRKKIEDNFQLDRMVTEYASLYHRLVVDKRGNP